MYEWRDTELSFGNLNAEKHKTFPEKTEMPLNLYRNLTCVEKQLQKQKVTLYSLALKICNLYQLTKSQMNVIIADCSTNDIYHMSAT